MRTLMLALAATCAATAVVAQGPSSAGETVAEGEQKSLRERRNASVEDLAAKLEQRYVFPETGLKYANMLRANAARGKYAAIADDKQFAKLVTDDLEAVAFDGHLKVVPRAKSVAAGAISSNSGPNQLPATIQSQARLPGGIAYIRLAKFFGEPENLAAIRKFMEDNSDAKTVIFDVRTHIGGGLEEMDAIFPYLFDERKVLVKMDTRNSVESPIGDGPTVRSITGPESVARREHFVIPAETPPLSKAKVFVLTSGRTASAGEHFVLALKRTGRATVIGDTTYGAGNFGNTEQIAGGFQAFIAVGRTFDPDTDRGWDYVGIAPHVAVAAQDAMVEALVRSGVSPGEANMLSTKYGPTPQEVTSRRKAPASVVGL